MSRTQSRVAGVVLIGNLIGAGAFASDLHVDALLGDDVAGTGSASSPWRTITRAHLAPLAPGDRVLVASGIYDVALGEVFPITLRPKVPVIGAGADRTFVRGVVGTTTTLFQPGGGQVWYRLADLSLSRSATAVSQTGPGGADNFLLLERIAIENNDRGVALASGPGSYAQCAMFGCYFRGNAIGLDVAQEWQGFGGVFAFAYGCTFRNNGIAIEGTSVFGNPPVLLLQHSVVKNNGDDSFASDFQFMAPVIGSLVSEPGLIGQNGNLGSVPSFSTTLAPDPHQRTDSPARDLSAAGSTHWPPAPAPGVPAGSWWGLSFAASFEAMGDIDGRSRQDGWLDAGCDEIETPFVYVGGAPSSGDPASLVALVGGSPALALYLSLGASAGISTPYGTWQLEAPFFFLAVLPMDASGQFIGAPMVPPDPALVGIEFFLQGHTASPTVELTPLEVARILP